MAHVKGAELRSPQNLIIFFSTFQSSNAWSLLGHVKYLTQRLEEACDCYERTLAYIDEPTDIHSVLLRLASIYLKHAQVRKEVIARKITVSFSRSGYCCVKTCRRSDIGSDKY